jgi:hypothetical protein
MHLWVTLMDGVRMDARAAGRRDLRGSLIDRRMLDLTNFRVLGTR